MQRSALFGLGLGLALLAGACELLTHASDYQVAPSPSDEAGLCAACPVSAAALRHAPCPPAMAGAGSERVRIYAARRLYFGRPGEWRGAAGSDFDLGFDLDCSERPDARPVLCAPRAPEGGSAIAWERLPRGIDNAWLQRVLSPLLEAAAGAGKPFDLDAVSSEHHERGVVGLLVEIEGWNGARDDDEVRVTVAASPGVDPENGPPRWDRTDRWSTYPELGAVGERYFHVKNARGYVADGVLVVDLRGLGNVDFRLGTASGSFALVLRGVFLVGAIEPERLTHVTMAGQADLEAAYASIPEIVSAMPLCSDAARSYVERALSDLLVGAADMPRDDGAEPSEPCGAISFAWAFDAEPALLGAERNGEALDGGCSPDGGAAGL